MQDARSVAVEVLRVEVVDVIQLRLELGLELRVVLGIVGCLSRRGEDGLLRLILREPHGPGHPLRREEGALPREEFGLQHGGLGVLDHGEAHGPEPAGIAGLGGREAQRDHAVGLDRVTGRGADRVGRGDLAERGEREVMRREQTLVGHRLGGRRLVFRRHVLRPRSHRRPCAARRRPSSRGTRWGTGHGAGPRRSRRGA